MIDERNVFTYAQLCERERPILIKNSISQGLEETISIQQLFMKFKGTISIDEEDCTTKEATLLLLNQKIRQEIEETMNEVWVIGMKYKDNSINFGTMFRVYKDIFLTSRHNTLPNDDGYEVQEFSGTEIDYFIKKKYLFKQNKNPVSHKISETLQKLGKFPQSGLFSNLKLYDEKKGKFRVNNSDYCFLKAINLKNNDDKWLFPSSISNESGPIAQIGYHQKIKPFFFPMFFDKDEISHIRPNFLFQGFNKKLVSVGKSSNPKKFVIKYNGKEEEEEEEGEYLKGKDVFSLSFHTASCVGGSSGSPIVDLLNPQTFMGIHLGSWPRDNIQKMSDDKPHVNYNLFLNVKHPGFILDYSKIVIEKYIVDKKKLPNQIISFIKLNSKLLLEHFNTFSQEFQSIIQQIQQNQK